MLQADAAPRLDAIFFYYRLLTATLLHKDRASLPPCQEVFCVFFVSRELLGLFAYLIGSPWLVNQNTLPDTLPAALSLKKKLKVAFCRLVAPPDLLRFHSRAPTTHRPSRWWVLAPQRWIVDLRQTRHKAGQHEKPPSYLRSVPRTAEAENKRQALEARRLILGIAYFNDKFFCNIRG